MPPNNLSQRHHHPNEVTCKLHMLLHSLQADSSRCARKHSDPKYPKQSKQGQIFALVNLPTLLKSLLTVLETPNPMRIVSLQIKCAVLLQRPSLAPCTLLHCAHRLSEYGNNAGTHMCHFGLNSNSGSAALCSTPTEAVQNVPTGSHGQRGHHFYCSLRALVGKTKLCRTKVLARCCCVPQCPVRSTHHSGSSPPASYLKSYYGFHSGFYLNMPTGGKHILIAKVTAASSSSTLPSTPQTHIQSRGTPTRPV